MPESMASLLISVGGSLIRGVAAGAILGHTTSAAAEVCAHLQHHPGKRAADRVVGVIFVALGLAVLPWRAWQDFRLVSAAAAAVSEWETIGRWARASTPPESIFLISLTEDSTTAEISTAERLDSEASAAASAVFEATSRRRIWVDFKRGAAVMWRPSYHAEWKPRVDAILELRTLRGTLTFAQRNNIDYITGDCRAFQAAYIDPLFRTNVLCVSAALDAANRQD
jgi:hypothetical protein